MFRRSPLAVFAAGLVLVGLCSAPAFAGSGSASQVRTMQVVPQALEVSSNGSSYTQVSALGNIVADVMVNIETGGSINSWETWLRIGTEAQEDAGQSWAEFDLYPVTQHYAQGHKPKKVGRTVQVVIPSAAYKVLALGQCNAMAERLRGLGLSDQQIFGQDRTIPMGVRAALHYDSNPFGQVFGAFGYSDDELSWAEVKKFDLVCKKWQGAAIPQASGNLSIAPATVTQASLTLIEQYGPTGLCKLVLSGVLQTSRPNIEVTFRYMDKLGHQSQVYSVTTDHAKTAMFSHEYNIANNPDGGESGEVRMVGVSHDFHSAWSAYDMNCTAPGATGLQAILPPYLQMTVVPDEKIMVGGQLCVSRVKLIGEIKGRSPMSGYAGFVGGRHQHAVPQPYHVEEGEIVRVEVYRDIDWAPDPQGSFAAGPVQSGQPKSRTVDVGFNVTDSNHVVIASLPKKGYHFTCQKPQVNPAVAGGAGGLTVAPRPGEGPAAAEAGPQVALLAALPDLTISQAKPGKNKNRLRVHVVNSGPGAAGATKLKAVYQRDGKNIVRVVPVQALKGGAKIVVVVDFGEPVADARRISLTVDPQGQVKEQKEHNNTLQFKG